MSKTFANPDRNPSIPFRSKKNNHQPANYLPSIRTREISQGYCREQARAGKMEERRDNLIGLFYLTFMILMKNDLNKWSYLPLSSLFILNLVRREILPRIGCFTQFTTLCDCSIKYQIRDRKGYGFFYYYYYLLWKKKKHLERSLARRIKTRGIDDVFCRKCSSIFTRLGDIKPQLGVLY